MKNLYYICAIICGIMAVSCEKSNGEINENHIKEPVLTYSEPLTYASLEDMRNSIYSGSMDVKSSDFISYAETVMQEDGYDDLPWSIRSEAFASILNVDGEVIFDNTFLKLCRFGVIYAPIDTIEKARLYASYEDCQNLVSLAADIPSYLSTADYTYSFIDDPDIFVYDSFDIITGEDTRSLETKAPIIETEFKEYMCDQEDLLKKGKEIKWKKDFNVVNGDEQKHYFTSDICNDTRIFQDNYGIYSESGVVTKTMKKNLIWKKFENKLHAGITDLILHEEYASFTFHNLLEPIHEPVPCLCIHNFTIDIAGETKDRDLVLATVGGYSKNDILNMTNSAYETLKEKIQTWASEKGHPNLELSGIRFYVEVSDKRSDCYIRLNNEESTKVTEDMKILMNFFWGGANIKAVSSLLNENNPIVTIPLEDNNTYHVEKVIMYGNSVYDNESKGSRLIYNYVD